MKRNIFRFVALLMVGCLLAFACGKENNTHKKDNGKGGKAGNTTSDIKITIDGKFADWDALTPEVDEKDDFVSMVKGSAGEAIAVIKAASDDYNLYFYAEILIEALPQNAICTEWGDSWNGTPEKGYKGDGGDNEKFSEDFCIFIDPDNNDATGFYTYKANDADEPAIPGLGCEQCSQEFFFFNYEENKLCCAWNQTNIGPATITNAEGEVVPYDYNGTYFQEADWNADGTTPQYGWQNYLGDGAGDNIAPRPENIKSIVDGLYVKVEFAIELSEIVNLEDDAEEYAWGVCYRFGDWNQDIGPVSAKYVK